VPTRPTLALGESGIDGPEDAPKEVVLFVVGKTTPIVLSPTVLAICRRVYPPVLYKQWGRQKARLKFEIVDPPEYHGVSLDCFVRCEENWKDRPPSRTKLCQIACVALGRPLRKGDRINDQLFVGRVFRCTVAQAGNGPTAYSIIRDIIDAETGPR
jgi:hypothetical protein